MLQKPEIRVFGPKNIVRDKILHFGTLNLQRIFTNIFLKVLENPRVTLHKI